MNILCRWIFHQERKETREDSKESEGEEKVDDKEGSEGVTLMGGEEREIMARAALDGGG